MLFAHNECFSIVFALIYLAECSACVAIHRLSNQMLNQVFTNSITHPIAANVKWFVRMPSRRLMLTDLLENPKLCLSSKSMSNNDSS